MTVYATRALVETCCRLAADADPEPVSVSLVGEPAHELDADDAEGVVLDDLNPETEVLAEFYLPGAGDALAKVFGMDLATPAGTAGSHGYARAAGGVRLATGTPSLAVVPISAFAAADERWIVPLDPVTLSIEREETPVALRADDRVVETLPGRATIEVVPDGNLPTLVPPQATSVRGE